MTLKEQLKYDKLHRTRLRIMKCVENKNPVYLHTSVWIDGVKQYVSGNGGALFKGNTQCLYTTHTPHIKVEIERK